MADKYERLLSYPQVTKIEPREKFNVPAVDPGLWKSRGEKFLNLIKNYLKMPYVFDIFGTKHRQRREWRDNILDKDLIDTYKYNALKLGNLSTLFYYLGFMQREYVGSNRDGYEKYTHKLETAIDIEREYRNYDDKKKYQTCQEIKEILLNFLVFLCDQTK